MENSPEKGQFEISSRPVEYLHGIVDYIKAKYQSGPIKDDGKRDAIIYAGAALMLHSIEDLMHVSQLSGTDAIEDWHKEEARKLFDAIEKAKGGNWEGVRECLQRDADITRHSSTLEGPTSHSPEEAEEAEKEADAIVNLARSI